MAELSLAATPEPTNVPPRVRIDVTDTGNSPVISSVTVTRTDENARTISVRSNDGNPLLLESKDGVRVGTIYDYEVPFGTSVVYSTLQQPENSSTAVVVDEGQPWLIHPGQPNLSQPVEFRIGSFAEETRAVRSGVFRPLGRASAVVVTDGRRKGIESSFTVGTETLGQLSALLSLLDDAGVLMLNIPGDSGLGIASAYVAVLDVRVRRRSDIGSDPARDVEMPFVVVEMPTGGTPTSWTWADVMAKHPTWQDVIDRNRTWAALLEPTA